MGAEGKGSILGALWQGKYYVILVFALVLMITFGTYYFLDARALASSLGQKTSDFDDLNSKYDKLSGDHAALVTSNDDLQKKYNNVSDQFNRLAVEKADLQGSYNSLKSTYDGLNGSVTRMQETSGAVVAMHSDFYEGGPTSNRKNYLEATVYNVGNKKADHITIKARILNADNTTSVSEQRFDNVDALDKRHVKWEYSTAVSLESVWYET
jgi:hypothetical protein